MTHYLYRCFDRTGDLLYVGISQDPFTRFRQHRAEHRHWALDAVRGHISVFPSQGAARRAEVHAIRTEHPIWNISGRWQHHREWQPEHYVRWVRMLRQHPYSHQANKQRIALAQMIYRERFGVPLPSTLRRRRAA